MEISVTFESDVANAPTGFKACVNAVCQYLDALLTSPVSVRIQVGYGTVAGQALSPNALGQSSGSFISANYGTVVNALKGQGTIGASTLPANSPASGTLLLTTAEAKALGLRGTSGLDGSVGFSSGVSWFFDPTQSRAVPRSSYDLMGTVEHEVTEVLGRVSFLDQSSAYTLMDLFRYGANGQRQLTSGAPSYFSADAGQTLPIAFNNFQTGDQGDLGDWATANRVNDAFNDNSFNGTINPLSAVDKTVMGAIGYTENAASQALTLAAAVPTLGAAGAVSAVQSGIDSYVAVIDSGANVSAQLDGLETLAKNQNLANITVTSSQLALSVAQLTGDADALKAISGSYTVAVTDSAAHIAANLPTLAAEFTSGLVTSVAVTDAGFSTFFVTASQFAADTGLFGAMSGNYTVTIDASASPNVTLAGLPGHGTVVSFAGNAGQYSVTPAGNGVDFTVTSSAGAAHLSNITALQFSGGLDFVAAAPAGNGTVTSGNVTELYGAVFGRAPDVPGLAYYQGVMKASPGLPLTTYAQWFLASPEYVNNPAHAYAANAAGDAQFVTDSYQNLLHRGPETGAVGYYQNIINQLTAGTTQGSAAYTAALAVAHAVVLTDFSQSPEFVGDVQITAAHPADAQHWLYLI